MRSRTPVRCLATAATLAPVVAVIAMACGQEPSSEIVGAMDSLAQPMTHLRLAQGDGYKPRYQHMRELVPEVSTMIGGGPAARDLMLPKFQGQPDFSYDAELLAYAYALGEMGDKAAIQPLADFVEANMNGDLQLAPMAATHSLLLLLGDKAHLSRWFSYAAAKRRQAVAEARASTAHLAAPTRDGLLTGKTANAQQRKTSCERRYIFIDKDGHPITYKDSEGNTVPVVVNGREFSDISLPTARFAWGGLVEDWKTRVVVGGGTYKALDKDAPRDPAWGDGPNKLFNCTGFAFRELNGKRGWTIDNGVAELLSMLTAAGLLRERTGNPAVGDKVFYFNREGSAAHVEEVVSTRNGTVVRGADNASGVFDASIDAPYFPNQSYFTSKVYMWTARPRVVPDPKITGKLRELPIDDGIVLGDYCVAPSAPSKPPITEPSPTDAGLVCKEESLPNGSCGGSVTVCIGKMEKCTDPQGRGCCPSDMCNYEGTCVQIKCPSPAGRHNDCTCDCNGSVFDECRPTRLCSCGSGQTAPTRCAP